MGPRRDDLTASSVTSALASMIAVPPADYGIRKIGRIGPTNRTWPPSVLSGERARQSHSLHRQDSVARASEAHLNLTIRNLRAQIASYLLGILTPPHHSNVCTEFPNQKVLPHTKELR
jgi:hypothetical protein